MLRIIILTVNFNLFVLASAFSQNIGIKVGGVYSNFISDNKPANYSSINNPSGKLGFQLGIYAQAKIVSKLYIQPELLFTDKGTKGISEYYLELPVLIKYKVFRELAVGAGPGISYLVAGDISAPDNNLDINLNLDVSYTLVRKIDIGIRYNYGLIKILDFNYTDNTGMPIANGGWRNYTFILYAGYKFELKKK